MTWCCALHTYLLLMVKDTIRQSNWHRKTRKLHPVVQTESICYYSVIPERLFHGRVSPISLLLFRFGGGGTICWHTVQHERETGECR